MGYKREQFSEIYGVQKEALLKQAGEEKAQRMIMKLTLNFIECYPEAVDLDGVAAHMRKQRARLMLAALRTTGMRRMVDKGNTSVLYSEGRFFFYYRGTHVLTWDSWEDTVEEPKTPYDHLPSTRAQRKAIREAVDEFRRVVLEL